jgi:hypothetical protein
VSLPAATVILLHRCPSIAGEGVLSGFLFGREVDQGVDGAVENSFARDDVGTWIKGYMIIGLTRQQSRTLATDKKKTSIWPADPSVLSFPRIIA